MYLEDIKSPADVKKLTITQLEMLSDEARNVFLKKVSEHGGHIGPNLGMVEATIAMHYVFNSPVDKMVWDVSHQTYIHKMLTGRLQAFTDPAHYDDVTGYTEPGESEHDQFIIGHTSTAVSLACGLAKARDLKGGKENVIAVLGDGSLSGGEAFEGLDNVAEQGTNMIIIFNDNQMSIAENHGGIYKGLKKLRETNGESHINIFKALGLDYIYVNEGNNIEKLIAAFQSVKDIDHPIVVHINTLKGHGYSFAENDKEHFHGGAPFIIETGEPRYKYEGENYADITAEYLLAKIKTDPTIVAINAGTPGAIGFTPERRKEAGKQFVDVGIAEEHAVAFSSGIVKGGGKPFFGVIASFMQRTYDQLSQDLCINNNSATIAVFGSGVTGMRDVTHLGFFDIPLISNIPNMVYLAPINVEEYIAMVDWSLEQNAQPVAIRVPSNEVIHATNEVDKDYSELNKYKVTKQGKDVAILAISSFYQLGESVVEELEKRGVSATLINPRYLTGLDTELLEGLKTDHKLVLTLEDGVIDGGFGEKIARFYGNSDMKVIVRGARKEFVDRYDLQEFLRSNRLTTEQIVEDILN